jgi:hypothetical protein
LYEAQQTKHILSIPPTVPAGLLYSVFVLFFGGDLQMIFIFSQLEIVEHERRRWPPTLEPAVPPDIFDFSLFSGLHWHFLANIIKTFFFCGFLVC